MRYVRLGRTALDVSRLGLDCHFLGVAEREHGWDPCSYDGRGFALRTVHAALDAGINLFATSPDAGGGRAESLLGKALRGRRQGVLLASTITYGRPDLNIETSILASMRRLRTDRIDVVYINDALLRHDGHRHGQLVDLERLRALGHIGHIGLLVTTPAAAMPSIESGCFDVVQMHCAISELGAASQALDTCQQHGLGVSVVKSFSSDTLSTIFDALDPTLDENSKIRDCGLKHLLRDKRVHMINVGMRWEYEVAQNAMLFEDFDTAADNFLLRPALPALGAAPI